ncbi:MAG: 2,3-bisphosphoglycerate-independent phosphoglycerate mutase [Myxococcales bacterium]|nr:2,3-bisphosphoglycerate-independent phosphoglycerate mutase [Myxococcales bacterium]
MKSVVLIILDGFGERAEAKDNAIRMARMPTLDALYAGYPHGTLDASGLAVGLPDGQMGNSEVGHLNLGSGRVVYQDLTRINKSIVDGDFFYNPALIDAVEHAKASGGALHLLGLTSPGGVHSSLPHAYAVVELAKRRGLDRVFWHAFLDGRDVAPKSAARILRDVAAELARLGVGRLATVIGRYYAMDRDQRWDRTERAYRLLVEGEGRAATASDPARAVEEAYLRGETDEFVAPIVLTDGGRAVATIGDGDAVVFWNFRSDRARQLTRALAGLDLPEGGGFPRAPLPRLSTCVCMCEFDVRFGLPVAFPKRKLTRLLGEVLSEAGLRQLRTAETEKYAHVTFFFNGGIEQPFPNEERRLVPSPRDVATYDHAPRMSAVAVTDGVVEALASGDFGFILVNFANPDMVGHTGMLEPAIVAVETVDACIARILDAARARGAALVITADHGNCETMYDPVTGEPHTAHTTNPVPILIIDEAARGREVRSGGRLCDVAPTVLDLLGLAIPTEMEGRPLLTGGGPERLEAGDTPPAPVLQ